jgi:hypothetical protein
MPLAGSPTGKTCGAWAVTQVVQPDRDARQLLTVAGASPCWMSALPGDDVALEAGGDAVVAITRHEAADEAVEVAGDLVGHLGGAHADDGQGQVARCPRGQRVG